MSEFTELVNYHEHYASFKVHNIHINMSCVMLVSQNTIKHKSLTWLNTKVGFDHIFATNDRFRPPL